MMRGLRVTAGLLRSALSAGLRDRRIRRAAARAGIPVLTRAVCRARKTSDTLFILGSGASIATYSDAEWAEIARHDSMGMNFWLVHPFVPTFYQFETPRSEEYREAFLTCLEDRAEAYSDVLFIFKDMDRRAIEPDRLPGALRRNMTVPRKFPLRAGDEGDLRAALSLLRRLGFAWRSDASLQFRVSLFEAVWFGYALGYRRIVLCGIDLTSPTYFWEVMPGLTQIYASGGASTHRTMDPNVHELQADQILVALNETILAPEGVTLSVARESSALFPRLPCHFGHARD